jgi:hypothetical protein
MEEDDDSLDGLDEDLFGNSDLISSVCCASCCRFSHPQANTTKPRSPSKEAEEPESTGPVDSVRVNLDNFGFGDEEFGFGDFE